MAYQVVRKKRFLNSLTRLLDYLEQEWGTNVAQEFLENIDSKIRHLQTHPYIGSPSLKAKNIRGLFITKHNRLAYRISGNQIIILNLHDTRRRTAFK